MKTDRVEFGSNHYKMAFNVLVYGFYFVGEGGERSGIEVKFDPDQLFICLCVCVAFH